jgi:acyl-CoA synthetase (NDP forming)
LSNHRLERLLKPSSIVVFGGQWAEAVIQQCRRAGFTGDIWPVHPSRTDLAGEPCYKNISELPGVPDACFVGVNKDASIEIVQALSDLGAGGAICFASGYSETAAQDADAESRQSRLVAAAGDMPIVGPNCYGIINYLDNVALWPDQHGGKPVSRGVAIITQSSNIAINLSMQQRGLPVAYLLTAGNQAQTSLAELATAVISDERVSALGLHIEGFSDVRAFEKLSLHARQLGKRIVILKTGVTPLARAALMSHTRSLSGNDAAASAFIERLGMCRVRGIGEFVETLKVLNLVKKVSGTRVFSMSCSGGEAALVSDMGAEASLAFPALNTVQMNDLRVILGKNIALANPLDYHTVIWDDVAAMQNMVRSMLQSGKTPDTGTASSDVDSVELADIALLVLDFPRLDRCEAPSWHRALDAYVVALRNWSGIGAVIACLPENMPESVVESLFEHDVVALCGMGDGLRALRNAAVLEHAALMEPSLPIWLDEKLENTVFKAAVLSIVDTSAPATTRMSARRASQEAWGLVKTAVPTTVLARPLDESTAKRWLYRFGVSVPTSIRLSFADVRSSRRLSRALDKASSAFNYPVVVKGLGVVHKSEANAIELGVRDRRSLERAIGRIDCAGGCLIEEYVQDTIAELLVSVIHDPVHGLLMTIGAGGITTEVLNDSVHCLLPTSRDELEDQLNRLRCAPLLNGFRGRAAVDRTILIDALLNVQQAAMQLGERLVELEINPLLCGENSCTAVDAYVAVLDLHALSTPE